MSTDGLNGWSRRPLGELADYINGFGFSPHQWGDSGLPIVRIENMRDPGASANFYEGTLPDRFKVVSGDLLLSWSATLMALVWDRPPAWVNQHIFKVVPRPSVDPSYLHHLLSAVLKQLEGQSHGTTMKHVKRSDLLPFEVCVAPASEQPNIGRILDTVDDAIACMRRLIAKLEGMRRGLLHDLLTYGIDETGEIRNPVVDSEPSVGSGRLLPEGWGVASLDDFVLNLDGKRVPLRQADRDLRHGKYRYFGASGVIDYIDDFLFAGDFVLLGEDGENVLSRQLPLAFRVTGKFWVNNHAHVFKPLPGNDIRFLTHLLDFTDYSSVVIGSAQPKLTQNGLGTLRFQVPTFDEQVRIADVLERYDERSQAEVAQLEKLVLLKAGLGDDLLTGRVRVSRNAEALA
jgi:type I restriction enzyme S subunit